MQNRTRIWWMFADFLGLGRNFFKCNKTNQSSLLHGEITESTIKSFYHVYNTLGYGFLEKVYENSLKLSLEKVGFKVQQQHPISVRFEGEIVGEYFADLLINETVIVELKASKAISANHEAQLLNYLRATHHEVGLLLNFGPKPEFIRKANTQPPQ